MRSIAIVIVLVLAHGAHATGPCENTETRYDPPELFDEATQSFAIPASQPWCDVTVTNDVVYDEVRGAVSFVELRDVRGKVLGRLSTAQGPDADHLTAHGAFEAVPFGKLHATLVQRSYKPAGRSEDVQAARREPLARRRARRQTTHSRHVSNEARAVAHHVHVTHRGLASQRSPDPNVIPELYRPKSAVRRLQFRNPCNGCGSCHALSRRDARGRSMFRRRYTSSPRRSI